MVRSVPVDQDAVAKAGPTHPSKTEETSARRGVITWLRHSWNRLQIGQRSMYSLERIYALDDYSRSVSRTRMIAVCVLTPLPALLLVVALELIPLQNPTDGWENNYGAWLRFGVISFTVGVGLTVQMKGMSVGISISTWKLVAISLATSLCHVCVTVAFANFWAYPVPFSFVLTMPPFLCCMTLFSFVAVGQEAIANAPNIKGQLQGLIQVVVSQGNIAIFYTGLSAVFVSLSDHAQIVFVALLPLIKLVFKNAVASVSSFLEEYVSGIVVFSAELAHALFAATCMQTARSPLASVVIISFDALSSILSLRSIYRSTRTVQKLLVNREQPQLIAEVKQACQNPKVASCAAFATSGLRVRSPLKVRLSVDSQRELARVASFSKAENPARKSSRNLAPPTNGKRNTLGLGKSQVPFCQRRIVPLSTAKVQTAMSIIPVAPTAPSLYESEDQFTTTSATIEDQIGLVRETAQLMFHCEYIVLIEYVECVIPMVYGLYLQALFHLGGDAHSYYPQTRGLSMERLNAAVGNLVIYVWLEVLSLLVLYLVIQRRFGFSILHQLAFVLETHAMQVQGRMFVWTAFILTFTLEHFGGYSTDSCSSTKSNVVGGGGFCNNQDQTSPFSSSGCGIKTPSEQFGEILSGNK